MELKRLSLEEMISFHLLLLSCLPTFSLKTSSNSVAADKKGGYFALSFTLHTTDILFKSLASSLKMVFLTGKRNLLLLLSDAIPFLVFFHDNATE